MDAKSEYISQIFQKKRERSARNALMKAAERFLKHAERVKKEKAEQENMPEAKEG